VPPPGFGNIQSNPKGWTRAAGSCRPRQEGHTRPPSRPDRRRVSVATIELLNLDGPVFVRAILLDVEHDLIARGPIIEQAAPKRHSACSAASVQQIEIDLSDEALIQRGGGE